MKSLAIVTAVVCFATSAGATEAWTCTYTLPSGGTVSDPVLVRFEVSPPDVIDADTEEHYPILQNNDYGLVATSSISQIESGQKSPTVGAVSIVIDKGTGEFWWDTTIAGASRVANGAAHGTCRKD
jgi:hypothetical protein